MKGKPSKGMGWLVVEGFKVMEKLTEQEFQARVAAHWPVFYQLYSVFEECNREVDLTSLYKKKTVTEMEKDFSNLPNADKLKKIIDKPGFPGRYETLLYQIAVVGKLFGAFGPGQVNRAFGFLVEANKRVLLEGGAE